MSSALAIAIAACSAVAAQERDTCLLQINHVKGVQDRSSSRQDTSSMELGVISYWSPSSTDYDTLPSGAVALVNPYNGIFDGQSTSQLAPRVAEYQDVVARALSRGVAMFGYVPTGYFDHSCDIYAQCQTFGRIGAQIEKYFEVFPNLTGIFFDEVAPTMAWDCSAFVAEFAQLRQLVTRSDAKIAFNSAVPQTCIVDAASAGEIVVLFEGHMQDYGAANHADLFLSAKHSRSKGVESWHLVHSVSMANLPSVLEKARFYQVDYFYSTDIGGNWQAGENTWGSPPAYWDDLKVQVGEPLGAPAAVVIPSKVPVGGDFGQIVLTRPEPRQCCSEWDWVGIYKKGSSHWLQYVHSGDAEHETVALPLDGLIANLGAGEYELKYSTGEDGWQVHDLITAKLELVVAPTATVAPPSIPIGASADLTLTRPDPQCCVGWDWVGIYRVGSWERLGYVHTGSTSSTVTLSLRSLLAGLAAGTYEFKFSTSVDGWQVHSLNPATLTIER